MPLRSSLHKQIQRLTPGLIILLLAASRFLHIGAGDLKDWDEAMYAWRAKVCVFEGAWLDQHHHSIGFSDDPDGGFYSAAFPPLYIWATAGLYQVFGFSEWAARFWAAAAGGGCILLLFLIGRQIAGTRCGLTAAILLSAMPYFCRYSRAGQFDVPYIFFVLMTIYLTLEAHRRGRLVWLLAAGVALGLGLMTKIAVALMAPAVLFLFGLYRIASERFPWRAVIAEQMILLATAVAVAAPWHLIMTFRFGDRFWWWTVVYHLLGKAGETQDMNQGNITFYMNELYTYTPAFLFFLVLLTLMSSLFTVLYFGLWCSHAEQELPTSLVERALSDAPPAPADSSGLRRWLIFRHPFAASLGNLYALPVLWFLFLFILFSLAGTKRSTYTLPMFPPMALIAAVPLAISYERRREPFRPLVGAFIFVTIALILKSLDDPIGERLNTWAADDSLTVTGAVWKTLIGSPALALAVAALYAAGVTLYRTLKMISPPARFRSIIQVLTFGVLFGLAFVDGIRPTLKAPKLKDDSGWRLLAPQLNARQYDAIVTVGGGFDTNAAVYYLNGANRGWAPGIAYRHFDTAQTNRQIAEALRPYFESKEDGFRWLLIYSETADADSYRRLDRLLERAAPSGGIHHTHQGIESEGLILYANTWSRQP